MTITLDLAPQEAARLEIIASRNGSDADSAAYSLLVEALAHTAETGEFAAESRSRPATVWSAEFRAKYNIAAEAQPLTEEELRALSPEEEAEAIRLGLEDSFAGRVTPLAEGGAKVRARHNLPEGAKAMSQEELMLLP